MVGGAVAGAIAASSLQGSPIVGGKGRKHRSRGRRSAQNQQQQENQQQQQNQENQQENQNQQQNQTGGMVPGLMAAVETAMVPLGLYLGQKALQSRRAGKSLGRTFNFRKSSRRSRRRR